MTKRTITCIICPRGCSVDVEINGEDISVSGNSCPRGEKYALDECTHPMRTVTSTVRVSNREDTMVSVKTADPIPKENIRDIMDMIHKTEIKAPVRIGDRIISDICGTNVVATKSID